MHYAVLCDGMLMVPPDDIHIPTLTVSQTLRFALST
jgi:ABC-type multidrug transport system ATPase subunit